MRRTSRSQHCGRSRTRSRSRACCWPRSAPHCCQPCLWLFHTAADFDACSPFTFVCSFHSYRTGINWYLHVCQSGGRWGWNCGLLLLDMKGVCRTEECPGGCIQLTPTFVLIGLVDLDWVIRANAETKPQGGVNRTCLRMEMLHSEFYWLFHTMWYA